MLLFATIIVIIIGSGLFSGTEAALFSVSLGKAMALEKQGKKGAKSLLKIKKKISRPITVIVIFNNIVNIVGSITVGVLTSNTLGNAWLGVISGVLTFLIIIFGEIIPKSIGENHAEKIGLAISGPLLVITRIFTPLTWVIEKITSRFTIKKTIVSEEEIKILSHLGHIEGSIEKDEKEMIQNVFRLNDILAKDIMTPRTVITAFGENEKLGELENKIYKAQHSRIPIYKKTKDEIMGVCLRRELLIAMAKDEMDRKVSEFVREVPEVSDKSKADYLLTLFLSKKAHIAIVKDSFGATRGVITLEDILEQLVGEIVDESDKAVDMREEARRISDEANEKAAREK